VIEVVEEIVTVETEDVLVAEIEIETVLEEIEIDVLVVTEVTLTEVVIQEIAIAADVIVVLNVELKKVPDVEEVVIMIKYPSFVFPKRRLKHKKTPKNLSFGVFY